MIRRHLFVMLSLAGAMLLFSPKAEGGDFFFKDGDVVVMLGDSITEQHLYSDYVEAWTVCRFPAWKIAFRNVGIGGDRSVGGDSRFQRDVVSRKPTVLTVDFGMNDGGYGAFNAEGFAVYEKGLKGIARQAKEANIRVAWITPSPFEKGENGAAIEGYNQTLEKFSQGVKDVAAANQALFIDQFHPYILAQDKARAAKPENRIGGGDAVHPGPPGQALMAWAILKGMNFPKLVIAPQIDAANGSASAAKGCRITNVKATPEGVAFEQQDEALPFFVPQAKSILQWAPVLEDLNEYTLKVTGLKAGQYEIKMDNKKVATCSDADLAKGVNLTADVLAQGPIAEQVQAVWGALRAKNDFHHNQIFRGVVLNDPQIPDWLTPKLNPADIEKSRQEAIKTRMAEVVKLDEALRKTLTMKPYKVEITPVAK